MLVRSGGQLYMRRCQTLDGVPVGVVAEKGAVIDTDHPAAVRWV